MVGIRVMVNQLRNAFAHRPWRPTWIFKQQHLGVFPVVLDDNSRYDFDTWAPNGQALSILWRQTIHACD
jgi:hypothetical protein